MTDAGWKKQGCTVVLGGLLAFFAAGLCGAADDLDILTRPVSVQRPTALEKYISLQVVKIISSSHYARHPVDADYSTQWFNEYFSLLDPSRMFFLQSDIEDFRSYEKNLGDLVRRGGTIDFAFELYERYLLRVQEWAVYAAARLAQPLDLTGNDTIQIDRREAPWPASRAELEDLWRRQLANRLLTEQLADESGITDAETDDPDTGMTTPPAVAAAGTPAAGTPAAGTPAAGTPAAGTPAAGTPAAVKPRKPPVERVDESYRRFLKRKMEAETLEVVELFLNALTRLYDPHSSYMAPDSEEDFDISMRLSLQGIGAVLTTKDSYVEVLEIVPGGPASRDGRLKAGDRIIAVTQGEDPHNPVDVVDMPLRKVVRMIRGTKDTRVLLTVLVAGSSTPTVVDIVRDKVELKEQEAKCEIRQAPLPKGAEGTTGRMALITLPSFYLDFEGRRDGTDNYASCTRDVQRLIENATKDPLDGILLDLRGNGGGALDEAVRLAGFFFDRGPVVQVRDQRGTVKKREDTEAGSLFSGPLIVLVDKLSASASEIVAAALQDHGRAVIVGESSTHGKGTVQTVYGLDRQLGQNELFKDQRGGSVKFTIQKFYRVNGGSTQVKGVVPDLCFPSFTDYMELGEAALPHVLPWDSIEPLETSREVDVAPWIPDLKQRFDARLQASAEFVSLREDIGRYAERRKLKELPLNLETRRAFQKEEEQWAKKMREQSRKRKATAATGKQDSPLAPDLVLDETVRVMADMIALQRGLLKVSVTALAVPPAATLAVPGNAPTK
jgi:carboxyl-terminal processing protease